MVNLTSPIDPGPGAYEWPNAVLAVLLASLVRANETKIVF